MDFVEITESLSSGVELDVTDGYVFKGPSSKANPGQPDGNGQDSRNISSLDNSAEVMYAPTLGDYSVIVGNSLEETTANPVLTVFPWMYPVPSTALTETRRTHKCLGKGIGDVSVFSTGSGSGFGPVAGAKKYPFNGKIYSGTLVQYSTEPDLSTSVIPYQKGRGAPMYSSEFQPGDLENTGTLPFGPLGYYNDGKTIEPSLADGASLSGSACVGVVLSSGSYDDPDNGHCAPFTVPPSAVDSDATVPNTVGHLSPGPNRAGNYYSPWPEKFAYSDGEPIPVLTRGITTLRIGAACNIAVVSRGIVQQLSDTDEAWVPVETIPLFQGEKLEAGSYVYAAVKGGVAGLGPYVYSSFNEIELVGQTPWEPMADATGGNIGWTGTPGLSFTNIPDTDVPVSKTLSEGAAIPKLHQACQGSIIVHPITTVSPFPGLGNKVSLILSEKRKRFELTGVSGRAPLSQLVPAKAQPVGVLLETVTGAGKWPYTGLPLAPPNNDISVKPVTGGFGYIPSTGVPTGTSYFGNTGLEVDVLATKDVIGVVSEIYSDPTAHFYPGKDIATMELLFPANTSLPVIRGSSCTVQIENNTTRAILFQSGGANYIASADHVPTLNITINNIIVLLDYDPLTGRISSFGLTIVPYLPQYPQDWSRIRPFTRISALAPNTIGTTLKNSSFKLLSAPTPTAVGAVQVPAILSDESIYAPPRISDTDVVFQLAARDFDYRSPEIVITAVEGGKGTISAAHIHEYGIGNQKGDRCYVFTDMNGSTSAFPAIVEFPGIPDRVQELIGGWPHYLEDHFLTTEELLDNGERAASTMTAFCTTSVNTIDPWIAINATISNSIYAQPTYLKVFADIDSSPIKFANPRYHGGLMTLQTGAQGTKERSFVIGGVGYAGATTDVPCYNMTRNDMRLVYGVAPVTGEISIAPVQPGPNGTSLQGSMWFTVSNYPVGTMFRVLCGGIPASLQRVERILSIQNFDPYIVLTEVVFEGVGYTALSAGQYVFQTERLDDVSPIVSIETRDNSSSVRVVTLKNPGKGNDEGDFIAVTQEGSHNNAIFRFNNNVPAIDLPPSVPADAVPFVVDRSPEAWKKYSDALSGAVNLMDKQVLVELRDCTGSFMESTTPTGVSRNTSPDQPPNQNIFGR